MRVGLWLALRASSPSADAAKLMDMAERLAVFPAPTDTTAVSSAFGVTFAPPGTVATPQTRRSAHAGK
jgi:hypothetical protein